MKKAIVLIAIAVCIFNSSSFAQVKIEKFCEVSIKLRNGFSNKIRATISFGQEEDSLLMFKDSLILNKLKKVNEFKTTPDILNYMSTLGWKFVSVIHLQQYVADETFYFKKEFDLSELKVPSYH